MKYNKVLWNEVDVKNKVVFLRLDLNVPVIDGKITSTKRIDESIPTIDYLVKQGAKIVILSHMGRVKVGYDKKSELLSLEIVAEKIAEIMLPKGATSVTFVGQNKGPVVEELISELKPGGILILENTRYNDIYMGEQVNYESNKNPDLSKYWAGLCDVFIDDAYGTAHRDHASTAGIAEYNKNNAIGILMQEELTHLSKAIDDAVAPFVVIFGGAKVSDKLKAVESCLKKADKVIISGGMAYTFLKAKGYDMGKSNVENDLIDVAKDLMKRYPDKIVISTDFLCSPEFADIKPVYRTAEQGLAGYMGLDIGDKSIADFKKIIADANTILWNGPMGVTEFSYYGNGTAEICKAIAERTKKGAYTVIGGGDSAAAAEKLGMEDSFSWISTGGGASLKMIEGSQLPALIPIRNRSEEQNKLAKEEASDFMLFSFSDKPYDKISKENTPDLTKPLTGVKVVNKQINPQIINEYANKKVDFDFGHIEDSGFVTDWGQNNWGVQLGEKNVKDHTEVLNKIAQRNEHEEFNFDGISNEQLFNAEWNAVTWNDDLKENTKLFEKEPQKTVATPANDKVVASAKDTAPKKPVDVPKRAPAPANKEAPKAAPKKTNDFEGTNFNFGSIEDNETYNNEWTVSDFPINLDHSFENEKTKIKNFKMDNKHPSSTNHNDDLPATYNKQQSDLYKQNKSLTKEEYEMLDKTLAELDAEEHAVDVGISKKDEHLYKNPNKKTDKEKKGKLDDQLDKNNHHRHE